MCLQLLEDIFDKYGDNNLMKPFVNHIVTILQEAVKEISSNKGEELSLYCKTSSDTSKICNNRIYSKLSSGNLNLIFLGLSQYLQQKKQTPQLVWT